MIQKNSIFIIILIIVIGFFACILSKIFQNNSKKPICGELMEHRWHLIVNNRSTVDTDSLLVKLNCGCDTLKAKK